MPLFYVLKFITNWAYSYVIATPIVITTVAAVSTGLGYLFAAWAVPWVIGVVVVAVVVGGTVYYMSDTKEKIKEKIT
jgi:hypothetical protein